MVKSAAMIPALFPVPLAQPIQNNPGAFPRVDLAMDRLAAFRTTAATAGTRTQSLDRGPDTAWDERV
jgi:hypothetical protein